MPNPENRQPTSAPNQSGGHQQGAPDIPEENNEKPGHDAQPAPETGKTDTADIEDGSDADEEPSTTGH